MANHLLSDLYKDCNPLNKRQALHDFTIGKIADRLCLARCAQTTFHNKHTRDVKRKQRDTTRARPEFSRETFFFRPGCGPAGKTSNRHECSCQVSTNFSSIYCVQIDREEAFFSETMPCDL